MVQDNVMGGFENFFFYEQCGCVMDFGVIGGYFCFYEVIFFLRVKLIMKKLKLKWRERQSFYNNMLVIGFSYV